MSINVVTQPQGETRLIARAKDGDEQAFEALFHAYRRRVYLLCARMTGDFSEAEDLAQETFLQLFRRISTFRNESAFFHLAPSRDGQCCADASSQETRSASAFRTARRVSGRTALARVRSGRPGYSRAD